MSEGKICFIKLAAFFVLVFSVMLALGAGRYVIYTVVTCTVIAALAFAADWVGERFRAKK